VADLPPHLNDTLDIMKIRVLKIIKSLTKEVKYGGNF
jgi:hypothetical protein